MRKWGIATIVTATFAACSPFSSSSEDSGGDASTRPDVEAGATSGMTSGTTGDAAAPPLTSCDGAPSHLFCDDFSTSDWRKWIFPGEPNPAIQFAPNSKAHIDSDADAPSPPIATFEFPERASDGSADCGYAWTHHLIDLAKPQESVKVAFDMRLVTTNPAISKEAVALVQVKDGTDVKIENYVMVHDPKTATIFEQWTDSSVKQGTAHPIGDLSQGHWVRLELTIDAKNREARVALDGVEGSGSSWKLGQQSFGSTIATVILGVGYACTGVGGIAQFDNVLVTSN
jgi:hypothetical protein